MDLFRFYRRLKARIIHQPDLPTPAVQRLFRALDKTQEVEISCDDLNRLINEYAECQLRGEEAEILMPLVRQHLDICRECEEEFEALLEILEHAASA